MRVYKEDQLEELYCNRCGRKIRVENHIVTDGVLSLDYKWGYFSNKDGKMHSFDLCEKCYDEIVRDFKYPINETGYNELI